MTESIDDLVKRIVEKLQRLPPDKWKEKGEADRGIFGSFYIELLPFYIDIYKPEKKGNAKLEISYVNYDTSNPMVSKSGPEIEGLYQKLSSNREEMIKIEGLQNLENLLDDLK
ncbi:hypothetical protein HYW75_00675 [Candidatus Pacearchaeota archaeon]|nr:hypothetical protein [Candidatus Pacearchaeota archaeon]